MTVIQSSGLNKIRRQNPDKKIVFCSGSFDLTHAGHVLFLESCKKQGDILVVEVGCDEIISQIKGWARPVMNEHLRIKMVDSLKPVDYCYLAYAQNTKAGQHPLAHFTKVFQDLKPDIYIINEDAFDIPYRKEICRLNGITLKILRRKCPPEFDNISASNIIRKIKNETN